MKMIRKYTAMLLFALAMLTTSFSTQAWISEPTNQTDIDSKAYFISTFKTSTNVVSVEFYNETEHLAFVLIDGGSTIKWRFYSNRTRIGTGDWTSTTPPSGIKYKITCPDGKSTTIKRHIALVKSIWIPNSYNLRADGTVCGSSNTPPPNQTSISTIQALYGPNFTVERMLSNRDLFRVTCTSYPYCYMDDNSYSWGVTYHSNTQKIAYRARLISWTFVAVRTKDTVTDQTAKDDIDILVGMNYLQSQPWQWVDYSWEERWRAWFN